MFFLLQSGSLWCRITALTLKNGGKENEKRLTVPADIFCGNVYDISFPDCQGRCDLGAFR